MIVIGGGASGFFAAINIAKKNPSASVVILEKTKKLLSKVRVSGGGRCNVTHACFEPKELSTNYPRGQKELLGPFNHFSTGDVIAWFSERGIELKMEADGRMFPVSNSSETIIQCFLTEAEKYGVKIWQDAEVNSIKTTSPFEIGLKNGKSLQADSVVIASGGSPKISHYQLLEELGHQIEKPIPSLFTFNLKKHESNELMGLAVDATVSISGTKFEEYGPVLFTHWGMSGPAILKLSSRAAKLLFEKSYQFEYKVEWLAGASEFIDECRKSSGSKKVLSTKPETIPNRLWVYLIYRSSISQTKNWADLSKLEITYLKQVLDSDTYNANGKTTFKEEFVTSGGVSLRDINMKTLESKLVPNIYLCGEVLNIDAITGGFNFQAAWTTAWLISENI